MIPVLQTNSVSTLLIFHEGEASIDRSSIMSSSTAAGHGQKVDLGENAPVKTEGAGIVASESLAAESNREGGEFASNRGIHGENTNAFSESTSGSSSGNNQRAENTSSIGSFEASQSKSKSASSTGSSGLPHSQSKSTSTSSSSGVSHSQSKSAASTGGSKASQSQSKSASDNVSSGASERKSVTGAAPSYADALHVKDPNAPHSKSLQQGDWDDSKAEDGIKKAFEAEPGSINDPSRLAEERFELNQNAQAGGAGPRQAELDTETKYDALEPNARA